MNRLSAVETVIMSRIIKKRLGFVYNLCGEIKLNIKNWNLNSQGSLKKAWIMSYMLAHLHNGWQVDQAILSEEDRIVVSLVLLSILNVWKPISEST